MEPKNIAFLRKIGEQAPAFALLTFGLLAAIWLFLDYLGTWTSIAFDTQERGIQVIEAVRGSVDANTEVLRSLSKEIDDQQERREREHEDILKEMKK